MARTLRTFIAVESSPEVRAKAQLLIKELSAAPAKVKWDKWCGQNKDDPALYVKHLLRIPYWRRAGKWRSMRIDLHKICLEDALGTFHSHPAWAMRIILWGEYIEEILPDIATGQDRHDYWGFLSFGIIAPAFSHGIRSVRIPTYTLWIRGPVVADIKITKDGVTTISPADED